MPSVLPSANRLPLATKPAHPAAPTELGGPGSCLCMLKWLFHKQSVTSSAGNLHPSYTGLLAAERLQWQWAAVPLPVGTSVPVCTSSANLWLVASCCWSSWDSRLPSVSCKYCSQHNCKHTQRLGYSRVPSPAAAWIMQDTFLLHAETRTLILSLRLRSNTLSNTLRKTWNCNI